jgi:hypothetical protein
MRIWIPSFAAVAIQPLVFAGRIAPDYFASPQPLYGIGPFFLGIVVVAAAVVLILGIPAFLLLHKLQRTGWTSLAVAGFLLGACRLPRFPGLAGLEVIPQVTIGTVNTSSRTLTAFQRSMRGLPMARMLFSLDSTAWSGQWFSSRCGVGRTAWTVW